MMMRPLTVAPWRSLLVIASVSLVDSAFQPSSGVPRVTVPAQQPRNQMGLRQLQPRSVSLCPSMFSSQHQAEHNVLHKTGAVMVLDLDKTSIFGNDGNDFGLALQWKGKPKASLDALYRELVSPLLRPAYDGMAAEFGNVDVAIYTRRANLLNYSSCIGRGKIRLKFKQLESDGQLYIPANIRTGAEIMRLYCGPRLLPAEERDVRFSFTRLIAARDAIQQTLGLGAPPTVVVTAAPKDLEKTAKQLGFDRAAVTLFDDSPAAWTLNQVVAVRPLSALPPDRASRLLELMNRLLPVERIDPQLKRFLLGAPRGERAIEWDARACKYKWRVPIAQEPLSKWNLPKRSPPSLRRRRALWSRQMSTAA